MWGLSGSRPTQCLKIGAQVLVWGETTRTWRGRHRYHCVLSPTPPGVVKLSPIDANVIDRAALEERLRSLAGPGKPFRILGRRLLSDIPRAITLVLPDVAVRAIVMQLEQLPPRREEQEALIRWRLGQEQRVPLAGAKFIWQVFPSRQPNEGAHMVLVIAVQETILAEYESACEAVGLLPQEVTVASFRLFDLWLKAAGGARCLNRDLAWVTVADGGLTCLIIHEGRPVFVRTKLLTSEAVQAEDMRSHEWVEKIVREVGTSVLTCQEHFPNFQLAQLVLVTDGDMPGLEDALGNALGVATDQLHWGHVETLGWSHEGGTTSLATLPVVAGLM
ncbi:MAG TPA: hypothetical protein VFJ56_08310 [Nitrospira sp.]|nr:hypothetical protein [Nitrospira sp.]